MNISLDDLGKQRFAIVYENAHFCNHTILVTVFTDNYSETENEDPLIKNLITAA